VEVAETLFDAIAHGDQEHCDWLRQAIADHFAGRPVEKPKGKGSAERIAELEARLAAQNDMREALDIMERHWKEHDRAGRQKIADAIEAVIDEINVECARATLGKAKP
jgi:hypothetical protein